MTMRVKIALVTIGTIFTVISTNLMLNIYFTGYYMTEIMNRAPYLSLNFVNDIDITQLSESITNDEALAGMQHGIIICALLLLAVGAVATVFISDTAAKSFHRAEAEKNSMEEFSGIAKTPNELIQNDPDEIKQFSKLLSTVTGMSAILLTPDNKEDVNDLMLPGLELVGRCVNADRVQIWKNEMINGELCFVNLYQWLSDEGQNKPLVPIGQKYPYRIFPKWERILQYGDSVNSPVVLLTKNEQDILKLYETKSVTSIPIIVDGASWGLLSVDDCCQERFLAEDEMDVLYIVSRMIASVINCRTEDKEFSDFCEHTREKMNNVTLICHM